MPQTLLSILALVGAAFFTIGQKEGSAHTLESIVSDEFEVAVAGALIQTIEYADSRAFDEATTPQSLRARLNLPSVLTQVALDTLTIEDVAVPTASFAAASQFGVGLGGAVVRCDSRDQRASVNCNDVSDIHDRAKSTWHDVTLTTPNGDPLPVEVHVEVAYVDATNPDVIVNRRTNHKRVDVWARSPILTRTNPNHVVHMRRVISFDPAVALEYLKRTTCVVGPEYAAQVNAAQARVLAAQATASAAHAQVEAAQRAVAAARTAAQAATGRIATTEAAALAAEATANQRAAEFSTASAAAAATQASFNSAYNAAVAAYNVYQTRENEYEQALSAFNKNKTTANKNRRDAAAAAMSQAENTFNTRYNEAVRANDANNAAASAADTARTASTNAWTAATAARSAATAAKQAAAQAERDIATAEAAAATATQTAAAADRALDEARVALAALSGCRRA